VNAILTKYIVNAKIGGSDHSAPEIIHLSKKLVDKHLTIELGGQNDPAGSAH
jgi:hypothetical protein